MFDKKFVEEEVDVVYEHGKKRNIDNDAYNSKPDRIYYLGGDIKGNKFKDHQLPKKNKK